MQTSILLIWLGALLLIAGVVFTAARALGRGNLSEPHATHSGAVNDTLEPRRPASGLGLRANWQGLALIAIGAILLLGGAIL